MRPKFVVIFEFDESPGYSLVDIRYTDFPGYVIDSFLRFYSGSNVRHVVVKPNF